MDRIHNYLGRSSGGLANAWAMYLCYFMALGAFLPFINLYYERIGLSGVQIGALAALPWLVGALTSLFWGAISDVFQLHGKILSLALIGSALIVLMLSRISQYYALVPFVFAYAVLSSPILPLLDSNALEVARIHQRSYGGLRVWGSIGWSISTLLVGALVENYALRMFFYCYALLMGLTFLLSLFQPVRTTQLKSPLLRGLRRLLSPQVSIFLLSIFLLSITMGAVNAFFSIYLDGLGAGEGQIGLAWALAALIEVPVMIFSGRIMQRIGASGLLKVAFLAYGLRWLLLSFINTPFWVLVVQPLQGIAFATFLVGGVTYMNDRAPEGLSTTAQAVLSAVSFGIGSITGALLGGYLYDTVGMTDLFRILILLVIVGLAIFWLGNSLYREPGVEMGLGGS